MHFLSDAVIPCEMCQSKRYSSDILSIKYKDRNISDILNMTVKTALEFFENHPLIFHHLKNLDNVGAVLPHFRTVFLFFIWRGGSEN